LIVFKQRRAQLRKRRCVGPHGGIALELVGKERSWTWKVIRRTHERRAYAITEEGKNGVLWAQFRQAFAVAAVTVPDRSFLCNIGPHFGPVFKPGDFRADPTQNARTAP
jgi:hypothetical protein